MIDHKLKAIFLHIGKTAGSSVEHMMSRTPLNSSQADRQILYGYDKEEGIYLQHANAKTVKRLVGEEIFDTYYKFSIVRNPYSRLLSVYHYLIDQHTEQFGSFKGYIESLPKMLGGAPHKGSHHSPQTDYTHINQEYVLDYVGRFEELPYSIDPVRKMLEITRALGCRNTHRSKDWQHRSVASYYSSSMRRIVQDCYETDFLCFDYSSEPRDIPFSYWTTYLNSAKRRIKPLVPLRIRSIIRRLI